MGPKVAQRRHRVACQLKGGLEQGDVFRGEGLADCAKDGLRGVCAARVAAHVVEETEPSGGHDGRRGEGGDVGSGGGRLRHEHRAAAQARGLVHEIKDGFNVGRHVAWQRVLAGPPDYFLRARGPRIGQQRGIE